MQRFRIVVWIVISGIVITVGGCGSLFNSSDQGSGSESLSVALQLPLSTSSFTVGDINVTLEHADSGVNSITQTLNVDTSTNTATHTFSDIASGTWTITVQVYDDAGELVATGSSEMELTGGITQTANVALDYLFGDLSLVIDLTGGAESPDIVLDSFNTYSVVRRSGDRSYVFHSVESRADGYFNQAQSVEIVYPDGYGVSLGLGIGSSSVISDMTVYGYETWIDFDRDVDNLPVPSNASVGTTIVTFRDSDGMVRSAQDDISSDSYIGSVPLLVTPEHYGTINPALDQTITWSQTDTSNVGSMFLLADHGSYWDELSVLQDLTVGATSATIPAGTLPAGESVEFYVLQLDADVPVTAIQNLNVSQYYFSNIIEALFEAGYDIDSVSYNSFTLYTRN